MIVNVPENGPTTLIARDGRVYTASQAPDGRIMLDIPPAEYVLLTMGPQGAHWANANPDAAAELGKFRLAL